MRRRTVYTSKGPVVVVSKRHMETEPLVPITADRFEKATARLKEAFGQGVAPVKEEVDVNAQRRVIVRQQEAEPITNKRVGKTRFIDIDLIELKKQMQKCYEAGCRPDLNRIPWASMRAPVVRRVLEIMHQFFGDVPITVNEYGDYKIEKSRDDIEFDVINIGSIIRVTETEA
jgi:hypothetical protein